MKNSIKRLVLAAVMMLGLCAQTSAQHYQSPWASLNEYVVQVRVNPKDKFAAHFRSPVVIPDRLSFHFTEFDSQQEAVSWATAHPDFQLLGIYAVDPAPTAWQTVQVESNYSDAVDAWYEIDGNTDGLEVQIKTRTMQVTFNTLIGGSMYDYANSSSSMSWTDYYYDFKVKIRLVRRTMGYLIDTNSRYNSVILKTFKSQADFATYMNLHPSYDLVESQSYWTPNGYTSEAFHVRTAETMDEANDIMEFIEDENSYSSFLLSLGYFWNP